MRTHTSHPLRFIAFCLFTFFLLTSCGSSSRRFRLEGQFKNLNQGEFILYNLDLGIKDTIAVRDGRFVLDRPMTDTVTFVMLFPNFSELPIFVCPGAEIEMEGDVTHLRETTIKGTDDNEAMTAFRIKTNEMTPPDVQKQAQQFIKEHPTSPVSNYLLRRHFIQCPEPDYPLALKLCADLHKAQPQNQQLARLNTLLENLKNNTQEGALPPFSAVATNGDSVSNATLDKDLNIIAVWSSWNSDSHGALRQLANLVKDYPNRLSVITISLDASPSEGRRFLERDSIQWPNVCDSLLWQSPLLAQLGIGTLPANILIDKEGNIIGRNMTSNEMRNKVESVFEE